MSIILDGTTGITTPGLTNTGTETILNLTTTGNTILGDATTDTLNVGAGGLVKDSSGNVGIGTASPGRKLDVSDSTTDVAKITTSSVSDSTLLSLQGGSGVRQRFLPVGGTGNYNWQVAASTNVANAFEITPSTASGGSTFSSPAVLITSSGNLGLGVTPSAWNTSMKAFQVSSVGSLYGTSNSLQIGCNTYNNTSGNNTYLTSTAATLYQQYNGTHAWYYAASGTAGNTISFTQAMTLDSAGNLGIGSSATSPSAKVDVNPGSSYASDVTLKITSSYADGYRAGVQLNNTYTGGRAYTLFSTNNSDGGFGGGKFVIYDTTASAGRLVIDSSGNVGIGTSSPSYKLDINPGTAGGGLQVYNSANANTSRVRVANSISALDMGHDGTGGYLEEIGAYPIRFYTNNSERMRIDSSGNLLVGTTTNANSIKCKIKAGQGDQLELDNSGNQFTSLYYSNNGTIKVSTYWDNTNARYYMIPVTGGVYLASGGTSWTANSDERNKDIIEPITDGLNKVVSLRSVIGKYKTDAEGTRRSFLIAQDVQAVLPEAVEAGNPDDLGVNYTDVIPLLVAAIKELKAEFDAYKATHP